jgi:hypothetical protein
MDSRELRINNHVLARGAEAQIKAIDETHAKYIKKNLVGEDRIPLKFIQGIPLKEDWLLNIDLEKSPFYVYIANNGCFYLSIQNPITQDDFYNYEIEIKYIHELQNIAYELTKEELTYKS